PGGGVGGVAESAPPTPEWWLRARGSGLDRDLDRLAARDDVDRLEHLVETEAMGNEVVDGHRTVRDEAERLLVVLRARAVRTDDREPPLARDHLERLLLRRAGRRSRDDDIRPAAVRELAHLRDRVLLARGDRGVRVHERRGHVEALARELDEEHLRRAAGTRESHVQAADRARADHDDDVPVTDAREVLGVDRARE